MSCFTRFLAQAVRCCPAGMYEMEYKRLWVSLSPCMSVCQSVWSMCVANFPVNCLSVCLCVYVFTVKHVQFVHCGVDWYRLTVREVVVGGHMAISGSAACHAKGIIHQDIRPSNIMVTTDQKSWKIVDLGSAAPVLIDGKDNFAEDLM